MLKNVKPDRIVPWRTIVLFVTILAIIVVLWQRESGSNQLSIVEMPVVCLHCGYTGGVRVSSTPAAEQWPRSCPACQHIQLYMARPCPFCGKPIPMKDPSADKLGIPKTCPSCGRQYTEE